MGLDAVGIAWYRPEDYDRLKAMFPDGSILPDTYHEWLKKAREVSGTLAVSGETVVKAWIDPITFPGWCKEHGVGMDVKGRLEYSRQYAAGRSEEKHQADFTRR
jgi:hypothetical protein